MVKDLHQQFILKAAEEHRLRHITLVGGEYEADGKTLCENDRSTLQGFADEMNRLKVPLSDDIAAAQDIRHTLSPESYRIVNIDPVYGGGQNFAAFKDKADIVIFCNIPLGNPARPGPDEKDLPAFAVALAKSDAKIAWISGSDSFPPEALKGTGYISVKTERHGQSYLVNKAYFESMHDHLFYADSPMISMFAPYEDKGVTSFHAGPKRGLATPEDWNRHVIRPEHKPGF